MKENREYAQFFPIKQRIYKKLLTYFIKRGTYIYTILLKSSQITHGTRERLFVLQGWGSFGGIFSRFLGGLFVCKLAYVLGVGYTLFFEIVLVQFYIV
jgi:hypothetical protein